MILLSRIKDILIRDNFRLYLEFETNDENGFDFLTNPIEINMKDRERF